MKRIQILRNALTIALSLSLFIPGTTACSSSHSHDHHGEEAEHAHEHDSDEHDHDGEHDEKEGTEHSGEIIFPAEKAKMAGLETEKVTADRFHGVIRTGGKVMPASGAEATVAATMSGIVRLNGHFTEGSAVNTGTTLFTITNTGLPEGDNARKAAIAVKKAREDYDRISKLSESHLATAAELSEAKAELERAELESRSAGAAGGKGVGAPMAGYVKECLVKDGDYVETGTPLMTITRDKRLQLRAELPERHFGSLGKIVSAKFKTSYSDRTYSLEELNGRIVSRGRQAGENSPFIPIIFEFDNAGGIVAGSFAEIYLLTDEGTRAISVPKEALTEEQGIHYVYVKLDEEGYERREVKTGMTDGERYAILSGLREGDEVVTRGAVQVKLASASKAIPGHTHNH